MEKNRHLGSARTVGRSFVRLACYIFIAVIVGAILSRVAARARDTASPAGFGRGMIQGALMPMAFPNLLIGRDVPIYSENNAGISYKLGYTAGVNVCGAAFFGIVFYRLQRIMKPRQGR